MFSHPTRPSNPHASSNSRTYWNDKKSRYPFRTTVQHMSPEDIDPRVFKTMVEDHFLRVPFDGESHWGFESKKSFEAFEKLGAARRHNKERACG